jgi:hypothetical protein
MKIRQDDTWVRRVFKVNKPMEWAFLIGCKGTSSQIPDAEKWCALKDATHLLHKEWVPNYHGSVTNPPWEYWMEFGLVCDAQNPTLMCGFDQVVEIFGKEQVEKILGKGMPKYMKYEMPQAQVDPYANAVPMPGAGKTSPRIKDVKGERLS